MSLHYFLLRIYDAIYSKCCIDRFINIQLTEVWTSASIISEGGDHDWLTCLIFNTTHRAMCDVTGQAFTSIMHSEHTPDKELSWPVFCKQTCLQLKSWANRRSKACSGFGCFVYSEVWSGHSGSIHEAVSTTRWHFWATIVMTLQGLKSKRRER